MRKLLFLLLMISTQLQAESFYLDASGGNDANDGLSAATAWQNLQRLRSPFIPLSAGDTVLFKRGEIWAGTQLYIDYASVAGAPVIFSAYGDEADDLPVVTSMGELPGSDVAANWTEVSPGIWSFRVERTPGRLLLDGTEVLRARSLPDLNQSDNIGVTPKWYWNQPDSTLRIAEAQNPALAYEVTGSLQFYSALVVFGGHFVFENIDFQAGWGSSLGLIASNDIVIRNCKFGRYANSGLTVSGALTNTGYRQTFNITVDSSAFDSDFTFFYGLGSERGCGDGVKFINDVNNSTVTNSTFKNWAHNAIELRGDVAGAGGVNNNLFASNAISAPDIPYAHPIGADGFEAKCQFNRFTRNDIKDCRTASQINGNNNTVDHNVVRNMRRSPSKTEASAHAFTTAVYGTNLVSHDNVFDHNLIYDTDESAFYIINFGYPEQVRNHKFRNNICLNTGLAPYGNFYPVGTQIYLDEEGVNTNTFQNNLMYNEEGLASSVYLAANGETLTLAEFEATDGTNGNTISNNFVGNPLLANVASGNYRPLSGSPAIDAGLDLSYTEDFNQQDRNLGMAPDLGAVESGQALPSELGTFGLEQVDKRTVALRWETITETATDFFAVERSTESGRWQEVGTVEAAGYAREARSYNFTDDHTPIGQLNYRLRLVDLDGSYTYSPIRTIEIGGEAIELRMTGRRSAEMLLPTGSNAERMEVALFSSDGKQLPLQVRGTVLRFGEKLPTGIYLVVVSGVKGSRSYKVALL
jgi:hypothetical protein